jgi:transcriptional regulator with XRE-family HTH domain
VESARLIREARLRAGLTQAELAERTGRDRSVVARWEQAAVAPSLETLLDLIRACGFNLPLELEAYDPAAGDHLKKTAALSRERRLARLVSAVEREEKRG